MINCVIYARFSSDNQRDESIDAQVRACKEYATHHGYLPVNVYSDEARSATTDKRPGFQQMVSDSSSGTFSVVLVHKLDRFSRDRYDSAYYKRQLKMNGVRLVSVLEPLDDSPESVILESVLEGMAEYYSKNLAREVMKGALETAYQCKHTGGPTPYGFKLDAERHLIIDETEAEAVRIMFTMHANGCGYGQIIDELSVRGHRARSGRCFSKITIHDMLHNEKYMGTYVYNRTQRKIAGKRNSRLNKPDDEVVRIPGGCPAIVDESTFLLVKERMQKNKHHGGRINAKRLYLLSGLVKCGYCGGTMSGASSTGGRNKTKYYYYGCNNRRYNKSCESPRINADFLEPIILNKIYDIVYASDAIDSIADIVMDSIGQYLGGRGVQAGTIKKKLLGIDTKIENIVSAITEGAYSSMLGEKLEQLENEKNALSAELATQEKDVPSDFNRENIVTYLKTRRDICNYPRQRQFEILQRCVPEVTVFRDFVTFEFDFVRLACDGPAPPTFHTL
ncbi:MAG: recombinase family protein [Eubacterium aggregans]|uniref:recombinase family protein n=1 Tax=Eubacterium aggregans TaxID=81409 RepID=UPI002B1F4C14|nr:recombinase family protein [Eubacterium aggregans]MEA5073422.1 recombinase family protein [Eubacterium aggregans]